MNDFSAHRIQSSGSPGGWRDAEVVPISALQHYAYCPRQCALIHVEQVWDENIYTLRGRRAHGRVDTPKGMTRDGLRTEHALPLFSDALGLAGRADAVEFEADGTPFPVEHKVGSRKKGGLARRADEVQLCAQALCLEEMFERDVPAGALYYRKSRRRHEVAFSSALRVETQEVIRKTRGLLRVRRLPPPVADARCPRCSLIETCMPYVVERLGDGEPNDETP
ncbi:MAG: CRISPR-associated protein Cas4 [Bacteroidota bacterium]